MVRTILMLVLALCCAPAFAATSGGAQTASSQPAQQPAAAGATPGIPCANATVPPSARQGAPSSILIQLDPDTLWRPVGSEVLFTIANTGGGLPVITQVIACFRWQSKYPPGDNTQYTPSTLVRSIPNANGQIEYGATIPNLGAIQYYGFGHGPNDMHVQHTALGTVPLAEMAVLVQVAGNQSAPVTEILPVAVILPVGVTNVRVATAIVLLCIFVAGVVLWRLAPADMVDQNGSWPVKISGHILAVIANPDGIASLSQFQVMLWTLVVAAAAIFVMVLSGHLISISSQMLTLLGIAGGTQILAGVNRTKPPAGTPYPAPGGRPQWSQMVMDKYSNEIDVTRVQMLMFTLITAAFVAIQVITTYSIPDISDSFMVLMGISNGVYLAGRQIATPPPAAPAQTTPAAAPGANAASGAGPVPGA